MPEFSALTVLASIGALIFARYTYSFLSFIYINLRPSSLSRYCHSNAYAIITGSSDGIGLGFAHQLLAHGFEVILHGRNESKLKGVQTTLRSEYPGRDIRYYISDAARTGQQSFTQMGTFYDQFKDLPITVLINNIGGMTGIEPIFQSLEDRTASEVEHILTLNSIFPVQMARTFLPVLKRNEPSLIMNVSSLAGFLPGPFNDVYSGSKAGLNHWSHSLNLEMRTTKRDVEVIAIEVGSTLTSGNPLATETGFFTPSPVQMARSALQKVGCGRWIVPGYWPHHLQKACLGWVPEPLLMVVAMAIVTKLKTELGEKVKKKK